MHKKCMASLFFLILLIFGSYSATEKYGIIKRNERWNADESPFIISDDLYISENARVYITPGVQILVGKPVSFQDGIPQRDHLDSFSVSITVKGALKCVGRTNNRIIFSSRYPDTRKIQWYGIIIDTERSDETEFAFVDINNAGNALTVDRGVPLIRNCIIEFNNVGIICHGKSQPRIYNCIIANNFTAGIRIHEANPIILNNIIVFNKNNGIWADNVSLAVIEYNCFYGNTDGDLLNCNPELGIIKKVNKNKDSTDFAHNLFTDPVFAGSPADSQAVEQDVSLQTDKSRIKDTTIAKVLYDTLTDSTAVKWIAREYERFSLSSYSPCIDAGKPGKKFNDIDGSRNDIGVFGGQEFVDFSKRE